MPCGLFTCSHPSCFKGEHSTLSPPPRQLGILSHSHPQNMIPDFLFCLGIQKVLSLSTLWHIHTACSTTLNTHSYPSNSEAAAHSLVPCLRDIFQAGPSNARSTSIWLSLVALPSVIWKRKWAKLFMPCIRRTRNSAPRKLQFSNWN